MATRASIVGDGRANRDRDNSVMRGPGRRRRCWPHPGERCGVGSDYSDGTRGLLLSFLSQICGVRNVGHAMRFGNSAL